MKNTSGYGFLTLRLRFFGFRLRFRLRFFSILVNIIMMLKESYGFYGFSTHTPPSGKNTGSSKQGKRGLRYAVEGGGI